ncbi:hypothetical protein K7X08_025423 [Anisodus acutangulus]|uniref:Uncharacterized protein n=2 Tax=Anisodus TaxID=243963 RepID=A0A9Q1LSM3_9SOLA|nr:hypothetical protein K7X08_025423 [Anisodus acutangulus]
MGPSSTRSRRTRSTSNSSTTTTIQKKKMKQQLMKKNKEEKSSAIINSPCKSPCKEASLKRSSNEMELENNICLTPKAERFKIPEIKTCPPAPKKRRIISSTSSNNCHSIRRSPVTFFAPPDLDLFFFLALGDIPV